MPIPNHLLALASAPYTASGSSQPFPVAVEDNVYIDVHVSAVSGTTPSMLLGYDRLGDDGVWYNVWTSSAITATGNTSISIGEGMEVARDTGLTGRFTWTITGTTPSFTFSANVQGK